MGNRSLTKEEERRLITRNIRKMWGDLSRVHRCVLRLVFPEEATNPPEQDVIYLDAVGTMETTNLSEVPSPWRW